MRSHILVSTILSCTLLAACSDEPSSSSSGDTTEEMSTDAACACPTPPAPACQDGQTRKLYSSPGCGADAVCLSTSFEETLEPCDAPPEPTCSDDKTVLSYDATGSCEAGECVYRSTSSVCMPNPSACIDDRHLKHDVGEPTCADGVCIHEEQIEDCGDVGCCEDGCCEPTLSNTGDYGVPRSTGIITGPPSGEFDTDADCTLDAILGECVPLDGTAGSEACVCFADTLIIHDLRVRGSRALVVMASDSIEVKGTLDVSAQGTSNGPGKGYVHDEPSVNGYAMGGTYASRGGRDDGATLFGDASLAPLMAGCQGQAVCTTTRGGGAGGALQLTALESISVTGTIAANGGGGEAGQQGDATCLDGAGGGSGGGILIEAPQVEISGTVVAQGGAGGSGGSTDHPGYRGGDGNLTPGPAQGGSRREDQTCALQGSILSGAGGQGASSGSEATAGGERESETTCVSSTYAGAGGGGGGLGYIRVNTRRGAQACLCGGDFSPSPSFGTIPYE